MRKSLVKYWFILPLMWLNILFGSQVMYPGFMDCARLLYWMILFNITYLLFTEASRVRFPKLTHGFLFGMFFFRIVSLIRVEPAYSLYLVCAGIVFVLAGFLFFQNAPNLFKRQITFFIVISVPVMFLQIVGNLEILHYFNTLYVRELSPGYYVRPDITMLPLLLNDYELLMKWGYFIEYRQFLSKQSRAPGLLYSSAVLAPIVLVAAIIRLSALSRRRLNVTDCLVVVAVVLTGSKTAVYGFIVLSIITYYYSSQSTRRSVLKLLFALAMFLGLYGIIFPTLLGNLFLIERSLAPRIFDFMLFWGSNIALSDFVQSFSWFYNAANRMDYGAEGYRGLSGMVTLLYALPFMLVSWVIVGPLYRSQLKRLDKKNAETSLFIRLSFAWVVLVLLVTPLASAQFYGLLVGVALTPLLIPRYNQKL